MPPPTMRRYPASSSCLAQAQRTQECRDVGLAREMASSSSRVIYRPEPRLACRSFRDIRARPAHLDNVAPELLILRLIDGSLTHGGCFNQRNTLFNLASPMKIAPASVSVARMWLMLTFCLGATLCRRPAVCWALSVLRGSCNLSTSLRYARSQYPIAGQSPGAELDPPVLPDEQPISDHPRDAPLIPAVETLCLLPSRNDRALIDSSL